MTKNQPGLAVDRREVFLLLFLVGPLNLDNGSVEVPELNFLTQSEGLSEGKRNRKRVHLYLLSTWIHPNLKPHVGWLFEPMSFLFS